MRDYQYMARSTIATRVLGELRRACRPLDDDELADLLGVRLRQTINQVCRKLERSGCLHRHVGSKGKIVNDPCGEARASAPTKPIASARPAAHRPAQSSCAHPSRSSDLPGRTVTTTELYEAGFQPLELQITSRDVDLHPERGCEWTTIGDVPPSAGLYAFTVEDAHEIRVAYVGLTEHLWMVTKGRLPDGRGARGGQRYGRPRHAGVTRRRINILVAEQLRAGRVVRQWVRQVPAPALRAEEERLIVGWELRRIGWNRG